MGCASSSTNHVVASRMPQRSAKVQDISRASSEDHQPLAPSEIQMEQVFQDSASSPNQNEAWAISSSEMTSQSRGDSNYGSDTMHESPQQLQISPETLQQFLALEKQIHDYERQRVLDNYMTRTEQLEKIESNLKQLKTDKYRCLDDLISIQKKMGFNDLKTLRKSIISKNESKIPLNLEEELFHDCVGKKESIERECELMTTQQEQLKKEIDILAKQGEQLQVLFSKRDELLDQIFDGQYASDLEKQLEKELDWLLEQKHHVDQAYFRWKQAHLCAKQACKQLSEAIKLWNSCIDLPLNKLEEREQVASETRSLLLFVIEQLQSCQRYLSNIELPYCGEEEVTTLEKAVSYILTDVQSEERHEHAFACYQTTFKRSNALKQWLEQVLNMTIARDLYLINEDCKARTAELRNERIRLVKARIKEISPSKRSGSKLPGYDIRDSGVDSELDESAADEQLARLFESPSDRTKDGSSLTPDPTKNPFGILQGQLKQQPPMKHQIHSRQKQFDLRSNRTSLEEDSDSPSNVSTLSEPLAPMPSSEQIFGRINELKQRFKAERDQVRRQQQFSQAKVAQSLKDKLMERRNRRSRAQMHEREAAALTVNSNS